MLKLYIRRRTEMVDLPSSVVVAGLADENTTTIVFAGDNGNEEMLLQG
jgi:hypothetical protein